MVSCVFRSLLNQLVFYSYRLRGRYSSNFNIKNNVDFCQANKFTKLKTFFDIGPQITIWFLSNVSSCVRVFVCLFIDELESVHSFAASSYSKTTDDLKTLLYVTDAHRAIFFKTKIAFSHSYIHYLEMKLYIISVRFTAAQLQSRIFHFCRLMLCTHITAILTNIHIETRTK